MNWLLKALFNSREGVNDMQVATYEAHRNLCSLIFWLSASIMFFYPFPYIYSIKQNQNNNLQKKWNQGISSV